MNRIAFVFTHGPHGTAAGREGLDALLAVSALSEKIGVFFIADGVLLLLSHQQPAKILAKDFVTTFGVLSLYNIDKFYLCIESALERGLNTNVNWVLNVEQLSSVAWQKHLRDYNTVITF